MGKAIVAIIGDRENCSYCSKLATLLGNTKDDGFVNFQALLPGATLIDADASKNPKLYSTWRAKSKSSGNIPRIAVFTDKEVLKGVFVARSTTVKPFTVAQIVAKIEALCPDCCVGGGCNDTPSTPPADGECCGGTCPKCGTELNFCPKCGTGLCQD